MKQILSCWNRSKQEKKKKAIILETTIINGKKDEKKLVKNMEERKVEGHEEKALPSEAMKDWASKPGGQNSELRVALYNLYMQT